MKTKIRVRNFQAIKDTTIEAEGLTVITGSSNRGKSALIRAIDAMLFGKPGTHFIRRNEKWCGASLINQDTDIRWRKAAPGARPEHASALQLNGTTNTKVGRDHAELTEPLGFRVLEAGGSRLKPQVAHQLDPLYLLQAPESAVAEVFKALSRVDTVTKAQANAKSDHRSTAALLKTRHGDLTQATKETKRHEAATELRTKLDTLSDRTRRRKKAIEKRTRLRDQLTRHGTLAPTKLPKAPKTPQPPKATHLRQTLERHEALTPRPLPAPPEIPTIPAATGLRTRLEELLQRTQDQRQRHRDMKDLDGEIAVLIGEKHALEKELDECPTCGRPW